jgi:hypothetical protein
MARTSVPKTAINEDREAFAPEKEVRPARERLVTPPACDAVRTEDRRELKFSISIALRLDRRHHEGALPLGEHVRHAGILLVAEAHGKRVVRF